MPARERQSIISKLSNSPPNSLPAIAIKLKLITAPSIQTPAFIESVIDKDIQVLADRLRENDVLICSSLKTQHSASI